MSSDKKRRDLMRAARAIHLAEMQAANAKVQESIWKTAAEVLDAQNKELKAQLAECKRETFLEAARVVYNSGFREDAVFALEEKANWDVKKNGTGPLLGDY